jgi:ATP-dependent helicase/DNAse subunit B
VFVVYLRSSSVGSYGWCQHKFFIEYNLGIKDTGNKKAEMGSVVHKALEILAREKLAIQNGQTEFCTGEEIKKHASPEWNEKWC